MISLGCSTAVQVVLWRQIESQLRRSMARTSYSWRARRLQRDDYASTVNRHGIETRDRRPKAYSTPINTQGPKAPAWLLGCSGVFGGIPDPETSNGTWVRGCDRLPGWRTCTRALWRWQRRPRDRLATSYERSALRHPAASSAELLRPAACPCLFNDLRLREGWAAVPVPPPYKSHK